MNADSIRYDRARTKSTNRCLPVSREESALLERCAAGYSMQRYTDVV